MGVHPSDHRSRVMAWAAGVSPTGWVKPPRDVQSWGEKLSQELVLGEGSYGRSVCLPYWPVTSLGADCPALPSSTALCMK